MTVHDQVPQHVRYHPDGPLATITLDRPDARNA